MVGAQDSSLVGLYSALVTPFNEDESLDFGALRECIRYQIENGVEGFYCCGSTGEGLLLSIEERKRFLEVVIKEVSGRAKVIAHTGTIRTRDAVELSRHAQGAGAGAVSMIPPYYYKFSTEEIAEYYETVIDHIEIGAILYNIPGLTGVSFTVLGSQRLLSNPGIVGIKHTSMDLYELERISTAYPQKLVFNGHDENFLYALSAGADGAIGTTVGLFTAAFKEIRDLVDRGDSAKAAPIQSRINDGISVLLDVGVFPAAKYAMSALTGGWSPHCRAPFKRLSEEEQQKVDELLTGARTKGML